MSLKANIYTFPEVFILYPALLSEFTNSTKALDTLFESKSFSFLTFVLIASSINEAITENISTSIAIDAIISIRVNPFFFFI
ncbi:hypothetical protein D3C76_1692540 [compost metagenome]